MHFCVCCTTKSGRNILVTEEEKERSKKYKKILTPFFCGFEKYTSKKRASADIDRGPKNILIYLAFQDMRVYNMTTTNKGRAKGVSSTPRPYAGASTSHTTV